MAFKGDEIALKLAEQGELERLKEYFRQRLAESGWREQVEEECRTIVDRRGVENITAEQLANEVLPISRDKVPPKLADELRDAVRVAIEKVAK